MSTILVGLKERARVKKKQNVANELALFADGICGYKILFSVIDAIGRM
jgi:hypothetical protein